MSLYEHVFIARQDISATQVEAISDAMAAVVAEGGGEVKKKEQWGLRNLSYRIKKNRKGHYVLFNIEAPSAAVLELERQMRLHEDILRYLTIRVDALEEEPSVVMRSKGARDDRGGRGGRRDFGDRPRGHDRDARPEGAKPADSGPKATKAEDAKPADAGPKAAEAEDAKPADAGSKAVEAKAESTEPAKADAGSKAVEAKDAEPTKDTEPAKNAEPTKDEGENA